jgi:hypothetical protein
MVEAVSFSEKSVSIYQTTQYNIPEDSYFHTRRRENLKSHLIIHLFLVTFASGTSGDIQADMFSPRLCVQFWIVKQNLILSVKLNVTFVGLNVRNCEVK